MKVFVYSKKTNKSIAIIKNVVTVQELSKKIIFITESGESFAKSRPLRIRTELFPVGRWLDRQRGMRDVRRKSHKIDGKSD